MRTRKSRLLAAAGALLVAMSVVPASAQTNVPVTLSATAGSRVLYVEDMTGTQLSSLAFGRSRSLPFRVRVVDTDMSRTPFTVTSTMTNLYAAGANDAPDYSATPILSDKVSLGSQANALNVLNVKATVEPLVSTVATLTDNVICDVLLSGLTGLLSSTTDCTLTTTDLLGKLQTVTVPVDLTKLTALPLVPQQNATGAYTTAEYGAGTAGAGDTTRSANAGAPTSKQLIAGSTTAVDTATLLTTINGALSTAVGTAVDASAIVAALQAQYPLTWGLLSELQINEILTATVASISNLTTSHITAVTGTYMALPTLNVDAAGAAAGSYVGTFVVSALQ